MHLFTLLFDLYSACSCSGVLCVQWLQLVQRCGEMWRHGVQSDDCSVLNPFFSSRGTRVSLYLLIKRTEVIVCLTLSLLVVLWVLSRSSSFTSFCAFVLLFFDMRMVQRKHREAEFYLEAVESWGEFRQNKCTHSLSFSASLTPSESVLWGRNTHRSVTPFLSASKTQSEEVGETATNQVAILVCCSIAHTHPFLSLNRPTRDKKTAFICFNSCKPSSGSAWAIKADWNRD